MSRPLLLDLFCGAGGASVGYHRAGFDVVGVDIEPQPHYPFEFIQADALAFLYELGPLPADVIHASPPCQRYSVTRTLHDVEYPDLVYPTRRLLRNAGLPYVIENVVGAPLIDPVKLCGSSFGLGVRRHRLFESNLPLWSSQCSHREQPNPIDVTGGGPSKGPRTDGGGGRSRKPVNVGEARTAMGIQWMTRNELNEAVPPAYTEFLGHQIRDHLDIPKLPDLEIDYR